MHTPQRLSPSSRLLSISPVFGVALRLMDSDFTSKNPVSIDGRLGQLEVQRQEHGRVFECFFSRTSAIQIAIGYTVTETVTVHMDPKQLLSAIS